jgi:hypothetical protein
MIHSNTLLTIGLLLLTFNTAAQAHPIHVTIGEAKWNADSGKLEVALRVHPIDLEHVLRERAGRSIDLNSEEADRCLQRYVQKSVQFRVGNKDALTLDWVGNEVEVKSAWLYFEVPIPANATKLKVRNKLFFELQKDQANTLNFRFGTKRRSLTSTWDHPEQALRLREEG